MSVVQDCRSTSNIAVCGYNINKTMISDEGKYQCLENDAVLLEVTVHVEGYCLFPH